VLILVLHGDAGFSASKPSFGSKSHTNHVDYTKYQKTDVRNTFFGHWSVYLEEFEQHGVVKREPLKLCGTV
jgi:hypothetical protein